MSHRPGMRNLPVPSTRVAPGGTEASWPTCTISCALVTTVMPGWRVPVDTSTIVTFVMAIDASRDPKASLDTVSCSAAAVPDVLTRRTASRLSRLRLDMPFILRSFSYRGTLALKSRRSDRKVRNRRSRWRIGGDGTSSGYRNSRSHGRQLRVRRHAHDVNGDLPSMPKLREHLGLSCC